jgi:alkyl hydroperoxide reductase subunit AhpC
LLLLQFTDEHGEVCPANWTPGAATMKADPKESLVSVGFVMVVGD